MFGNRVAIRHSSNVVGHDPRPAGLVLIRGAFRKLIWQQL